MQHFGVGFSIDVVADLGIGVAAAAIASWAVPAAIGVGLLASAPAWAPFALAAGLAFGASVALDYFGVTEIVKNNINDFIDDIEGE